MKFSYLMLMVGMLLCTHSLRAMKAEEGPITTLPEETLSTIFSLVDDPSSLRIFCSVSHNWYNVLLSSNQDMLIWSGFLGFDEKYKPAKKTWREFTQEIITLYKEAQHLLALPQMSIEEINSILSDEVFKKSELLLIKNLELVVLRCLIPQIKDTKGLVGLFIAHEVVNFSAARNAALGAGWNIIYHDIKDMAWNTARHGMMAAIKDAVGFNNIKNAVRISARDKAKNTVTSDFNSIDQAVKITLSAQMVAKMSTIYMLAYIAEKDFQNTHLITAYNLACERLNSNFTRSADEVIALIASHTWSKPELAENPYIISLQQIMKHAYDHVIQSQIKDDSFFNINSIKDSL